MSSEVRLKLYEINYVRAGIKARLEHFSPSMNDALAWRLALLDTGVPSSALPLSDSVRALVKAGAAMNVIQVRWKLSNRPKTQSP
jgi:hypothetical protein